jgi:hypothetical protein
MAPEVWLPPKIISTPAVASRAPMTRNFHRGNFRISGVIREVKSIKAHTTGQKIGMYTVVES